MNRQQGKFDSGVCCAAEALGLVYQEVVDMLPRKPNVPVGRLAQPLDISVFEMTMLAFLTGRPCVGIHILSDDVNRPAWEHMSEGGVLDITTATLQDYINKGGEALLVLPNKTPNIGFQWVHIKEGVLSDPSKGERYTSVNDVPVQGCVLFDKELLN